ncbi:hypothetical protein IJ843_04725 [bacterium]|nr:hypothetical protein [bacterium]
MIKKLLSIITILTLTSSCVFAADYNQNLTPEVKSSIQKYKAGNYVGCMQGLVGYFKKSSDNFKNQLATYYMAMSYVQIGNSEKAKLYYNQTKSLNPNNTLGQYAEKGIVCLDDPANCYINIKEEKKPEVAQSELDKFINAPYGNGLSSNLNKELERKRLERLRKEMNSDEELNKYEFKNFRDFTTNLMNKKSFKFDGLKIASSSTPTDAEIVDALRVLNAAGLGNIAKQAEAAQTQKSEPKTEEIQQEVSEVKSEYKPDLTREEYQQQIQREMMQAQMAAMSQPNIDALFGEKNNNNQNNMMNSNMMNMLPFMMAQQAAQNANGGNQQQMMSPEMMQTMMFNSMMPNFNFGLGGNN